MQLSYIDAMIQYTQKVLFVLLLFMFQFPKRVSDQLNTVVVIHIFLHQKLGYHL